MSKLRLNSIKIKSISILIIFLLSTSIVYAALTYSSGEYTNLCGTGTAATADTCNAGCNTSTGSCSSANLYVVKFTCSGRQIECRSNESNFSTYHSFSGAECNQTIQIDVFNKTCRDASGNWLCGEGDLKDYIVWYSGPCPTSPPPPTATPQPTSTPQPTQTPTPTVTAGPSATPTPTPTPIRPIHQSSCDDLAAISGNNALVPATITYRVKASDNQGSIQKYRFYFGDGSQSESSKSEVSHRYETSGTFTARVDIKDSAGNWKTSSACETRVTVQASPVESHKSDCSDLFISADNSAYAPSTVSFTITGYDNKGSLQAYRIDFGDGNLHEADSNLFKKSYPTAGTYTVRAYIKDSHGNWKGGEGSCKRTLYIKTQPLTQQPATGTETLTTISSLMAGVIGFSLKYLIRKNNL